MFLNNKLSKINFFNAFVLHLQYFLSIEIDRNCDCPDPYMPCYAMMLCYEAAHILCVRPALDFDTNTRLSKMGAYAPASDFDTNTRLLKMGAYAPASDFDTNTRLLKMGTSDFAPTAANWDSSR